MNDIRGLCDKHGFTHGLKAGGEVQYDPCPICERDSLREVVSAKLMKLEPDTVLVYTLPVGDPDPMWMTIQMENVSRHFKRYLDECGIKNPVIILPPGRTLDQVKLEEFGMLPRLQQMIDDLDRENGELSAQCCTHLEGDDHGNPTCKFREEVETLRRKHGAEAEDLRRRIETIVNGAVGGDDEAADLASRILRVLDRVDAGESLFFLERLRKAEAEVKKLKEPNKTGNYIVDSRGEGGLHLPTWTSSSASSHGSNRRGA